MTNLQKMMMARRIKSSGLSRLCGIKQNLVSMQMRSGVKTLRIAQRYAAALKCSPLKIMG